LELALLTVGVSASGALAPGPLFFSSLLQGARLGAKGGLLAALGHTLVELPYVSLLALGLNALGQSSSIRGAIAVLGALSLFGFAGLTIRDALSGTKGEVGKGSAARLARSPLLAGLAFTGLNPFFLLWWSSAGAVLITAALSFASWWGLALMYAAHVWMDYAFLTSAAYMARRGTELLRQRYYRYLLLALALVLVYLGLVFLRGALSPA